MQPSTLAKRAWFLLFIAIAAIYLFGLGRIPLVGPDEPRYAEVAREMLSRHDFITPTLGGMPWFEKPPLLYWMIMASYRVFGVNEFATRLGPAICGLLTAVFVYWIGSVVRNNNSLAEQGSEAKHKSSKPAPLGRWSALTLLSSVGIIAFSRAASFDIVLTMTLSGALACFFVWHLRCETALAGESAAPAMDSRWHINPVVLLFAFYFFIGLSLLAKGLIGIVLPIGIIALYFLFRRERPQRAFLKSLVWGIPIAAVTAMVWYGPMMGRHGWTFINQFIVQHHFARFLTNKYHHRQPFFYYFVTLSWLVFPWLIFFGAALVSTRKWRWRGAASIDRLRAFLLAWVLVPFIFFSFSESKLSAYILPIVPAAALMVGDRITQLLRGEGRAITIRLTALLMLLAFAAGIWYSIRAFNLSLACGFAIAIAPVTAATFALFARRMRPTAFVLFALGMFGAAVAALTCAAPLVARSQSVRDLLGVAAQRGYGATPIVQLFTVQHTAEFYAAGRLTYRPDGELKMLEGVSEVADAARRNGGIVLCLVPMEYETKLLQDQGLQSEELTNNGKVRLVLARAR